METDFDEDGLSTLGEYHIDANKHCLESSTTYNAIGGNRSDLVQNDRLENNKSVWGTPALMSPDGRRTSRPGETI